MKENSKLSKPLSLMWLTKKANEMNPSIKMNTAHFDTGYV